MPWLWDLVLVWACTGLSCCHSSCKLVYAALHGAPVLWSYVLHRLLFVFPAHLPPRPLRWGLCRSGLTDHANWHHSRSGLLLGLRDVLMERQVTRSWRSTIHPPAEEEPCGLLGAQGLWSCRFLTVFAVPGRESVSRGGLSSHSDSACLFPSWRLLLKMDSVSVNLS